LIFERTLKKKFVKMATLFKEISENAKDKKLETPIDITIVSK